MKWQKWIKLFFCFFFSFLLVLEKEMIKIVCGSAPTLPSPPPGSGPTSLPSSNIGLTLAHPPPPIQVWPPPFSSNPSPPPCLWVRTHFTLLPHWGLILPQPPPPDSGPTNLLPFGSDPASPSTSGPTSLLLSTAQVWPHSNPIPPWFECDPGPPPHPPLVCVWTPLPMFRSNPTPPPPHLWVQPCYDRGALAFAQLARPLFIES